MSKEAAMAVATGTPVVPVVETVTETPITEASKELESTRFTHLAKKEAQLVKEREEFKKEREQINAQKEQLRPVYEKFQKFEELRKSDPVAAIKMLEFSDEDFINYAASREDSSTPEERAAKAARDEIQKFQDEQSKKEKEHQEKVNKQVIDSFKSDISKHVGLDKDKYEYCNFYGAQANELIFDYVSEIHKETGEIVSLEEAADRIEQFYEDQDKSMSSLKKRTPAQVMADVAKDAPLKAEINPKPIGKTLSSKTSASVSSTVTRKETASEKRDRLINKLRG